MNTLAHGRFVQRTILTRFYSAIHNEVITKLDEKDQKADAEMKKVITSIPGEAWVFIQVDCPIVEPIKALVSKLKDQKFITEMKKVATPIQGQVWVFVQEDCLNIEVETLVLKSMGQVMRKMDEVNITSSTVKNAAQLYGLAADLREHGLEKVVEDIGSVVRVVNKDRDKLYANANLNVGTTAVIKELIKKKVLLELAHIKAKMKDMQAVPKKRALFGLKGKGNGIDANDSGEKRGNGETNGGSGGWGLMGMLKSLHDLIFRGGKDDGD